MDFQCKMSFNPDPNTKSAFLRKIQKDDSQNLTLNG